MTRRERALRCFDFKTPDRPCFDLMENALWPELSQYFSNNYGTTCDEDVLTLLDCDFRWVTASPPARDDIETDETYADDRGVRPLATAETARDVAKLFHPDPDDRVIPDFAAARARFPEHALVFCPLWMPTFSGACRDFGMQHALMLMAAEPEVIEAYADIKCEYALEVLRRGIAAGASEHCDIYWMGDDFASETGLILSPDSWRRLIKPAIARQVRAARDAGLKVIFHSCGAVSEVYPDFIDMGINAHVGVQTSASGMDIERLARDFGGRLAIFGGIDAQTTLVAATPDETEREVGRCLRAFERCGGYIVSNSHHGLADIKGDNMVAMARAAGRTI